MAASAGKIKQQRWCPECGKLRSGESKRAAAFTSLKRLVRKKQGVILTPEYVNTQTKMRFRCAAGHEWDALPGSVLMGTWCRKCSGADVQVRRKQAVFRQVQRRVKQLGGELLSTSFEGAYVPLLVRCARGHKRRALLASLDEGAACALGKEDDWLALVREKASEHGGACLSKRCTDAAARVRFAFALGHRFESTGTRVKGGHWCPHCRRANPLGLELMRRVALERGGECLSESYSGIYDRLRWRCARGHEWVTPANNVRRGGWCPECSHSVLGTLERLRALAVERGGRCITRTWNDHSLPLHLECERGHRFQLHANVLKSGLWCPRCAPAAKAANWL